MFKRNGHSLMSVICIGLFVSTLYGWNNEHWLGNCERVIEWNGVEQADYLRLGVLKDGVYRVTSSEIATALGVSTNTVLQNLNSGNWMLSNGTNSVAWITDGSNMFFYGEAPHQLYAPENVYFLRPGDGVVMNSTSAPVELGSTTNQWFMQNSSHRSTFFGIKANFDRRSTNASITNEPIYGVSLGDSSCSGTYCQFNAQLPGYTASATTNLYLTAHAISYGDFGSFPDTHNLELRVADSLCGSYSWDYEKRVAPVFQIATSLVVDSQPLVKISNLNPSVRAANFLLLDVAITYPCLYQVLDQPLLCLGATTGNNIAVTGSGDSTVMVWDITDATKPINLTVELERQTNGWSLVFADGGAATRYAVFETESCFAPSVCGFREVNWHAPGAIPSLVIVTPPRRWVSGFEAALEPLVRLRRAQGLSVRVVDAEEIYNAFSYGMVTPHAFQAFVNAGVGSGSKKLRYLLFAGYAATDYQLEAFYPDTIYKNNDKGFPALFPLLQVYQLEYVSGKYWQMLLPNDMMLGDGDANGVPDVAVGRFLVNDAAELAVMVAKTLKHDLLHPGKRASAVADWNDYNNIHYDFSGTCLNYSTALQTAGWDVHYYYCALDNGYGVIWEYSYEPSDVKRDLHGGISQFFYLGHSGAYTIGHNSHERRCIFNQDRISAADWNYPPAIIGLGCTMARYNVLDLTGLQRCIIANAVRHPTSGFSLAISSAGYLSFQSSKIISEVLANELTVRKARRYGDAWLNTLQHFGAPGLSNLRYMVLLGDPSMSIDKPRYPTIIKLH